MTLAVRSRFSPRMGRSRAFRRPWSASSRLLAWRSVRWNTLEACRVEAMAVARKEGIRGEPEVESYDGWHSSNGALSNPQGYIFSWNVDEEHAGEVVAPLDDTKPS